MPIFGWDKPESRASTDTSVVGLLSQLAPEERAEFIAGLTDEEALEAIYSWRLWARPNQVAPEACECHNGNWNSWLVLAGRGWGKTRVGSEWIRARQETGKFGRFAFVGRSAADVRDTIVEGEALALDTTIPTPNGWTTMGQIKIGDQAIDEHGNPTTVTWVSSVATERPCFRVVFSDGTVIIADENHKWWTHPREYRIAKSEGRRKTKYAPMVVSTKELSETLTRHGYRNHGIPVSTPLRLPDADLPIDPYVLGAWLGDGATRGGTITTMDPEVLSGIQRAGYIVTQQVGNGSQAGTFGILKLLNQLRSLSLLHNKHIPETYLRASHSQRLFLLQGLMDTDGYVSTRGQCAFDNTNRVLVNQVVELLGTLGIKAGRVSEKVDKRKETYKSMYRVTFYTDQPVFTINRKLERVRPLRTTEASYRFVVSVEPTVSVPVRCLAVDSPNHLFLIGTSFIPTHNSGIINVSPPWNKPIYYPSKRRVEWPNGAFGLMFSADEPEQLRGPQHDSAYCDELAAWKYREAYDQLMLGLRLGTDPRVVITTTPKPTPIIRELFKDPYTHVTPGSTYDNLPNLAQAFANTIIKKYEGTRLGRQELLGILLEDVEGALWNYAMFEERRYPEHRRRVVVAIDPSVAEEGRGNEAGIIVACIDTQGIGYVLADRSLHESPMGWAKQAVQAYKEFRADRIIAEANNGGAIVEALIRTIDPNVSYKAVHAARGKLPRAEPVVSLYEQNRIFHAGEFTELEDQLTTWTPNDSGSPDRLDALVWAFTELMVEPDDTPLSILGFGKMQGWGSQKKRAS